MRRRIVAVATLAAVLAIGLFGVPLAATVAKYLADDERGELEQVADVAAVSSSIALARGEPPTPMPHTERDTDIGLYDTSGQRISGNGPPTADEPTRRALANHQVSDEHTDEFLVALPISANGTVLGVIRATTPFSEVYRRIAEAWLLMAGLGVVAVLLVWLVARAMAARLIRPLERLAAAAGTLGDGDFSVRAAPAGIPEIDSVSAALNSTASRLDDLLARERTFSTDASHQLRTPLTGLRLGLEVALETPGQDLRAAIGTAIGDTERLQATIEDLLKLARTAARSTELTPVLPLLTELREAWLRRPDTGPRPFRINANTSPATARVSTAALRQVLTVLLDNAALHGAGTVTVTVRDAGEALAVDVADEGPGITTAPAQLFTRRTRDPNSLDPHNQGPDNPRTNGHGIGLALARSLTEAEGGRLRLSALTPPTFTVLLPAAHAESASADPSAYSRISSR
ncbi:MAG TPA: HAMP domain-containing sensor histidine kinase [Pseudonocardia sp.]|nr:HAMP domain-containing sensor histidine kinase [Pseudonocardia sp.]